MWGAHTTTTVNSASQLSIPDFRCGFDPQDDRFTLWLKHESCSPSSLVSNPERITAIGVVRRKLWLKNGQGVELEFQLHTTSTILNFGSFPSPQQPW